jgi:hypothetical protein
MGMGNAGFGVTGHPSRCRREGPVVSGRCSSLGRGNALGLVDRGIATGQMDRDHLERHRSGSLPLATPVKNLWLLFKLTALEWWTRFSGSTSWVDQVSDLGVGDRVTVVTDTFTLTGTILAINSQKNQYFVQFANGTTGWYKSTLVTLEYPRR